MARSFTARTILLPQSGNTDYFQLCVLVTKLSNSVVLMCSDMCSEIKNMYCYKIIKNTDQIQNRSCEKPLFDKDSKFWQQKKTQNWFCNRPLSPVISTDSNKKINIIDNILLVPGKSTEDSVQQSSTNKKDDSISEKRKRRTTKVIKNYKEGNYDKAKFSDLFSSSEEEPFSASSDEDPPYISDEEEDKSKLNRLTSIATVGSFTEQNKKNDEDPNQETKVMNSNHNNSKQGKSNKFTYKRKPDFCYFCETEVQNFARHVTRNHSNKCEVAQILAKPKLDKERRHLLDILRRKGNYLKNAETCFKPVRTPCLKDQSLLPCDNCLGFFSSKLLYRHRKKCNNKQSKNAQAAGQSQLISHVRVDHHLREQVFPRMRADKISLIAKRDILICAFGARYLKSHREKHFINVTSRKMRELARILIEVQKMDPSINSMFNALQCKYFDLIVAATKVVAKYNQQEDRYESPTFAMNIATSLKQCCDIAIYFALKKQGQYANLASAEVEANLKTMISLINTNWRYEISTQAADNLNLNKWNKTTIVPLASDLKLMREYLIQKSEEVINKLKRNNHDTTAYNTLMETVYCRVLLLNRRRPGELQRMLLHTYINVEQDKQHYEEFDTAISSTEKILLKKMKRVVIRGKRGRGVPVLFSEDIQEHIKVLLQVRNNFIPEDNIYLFAKSGLKSAIMGYKILSKYVKACGAKNPMAITSTRLRKHLATLSQVFNLKENELEQLATFMGHTEGVHKGSYRLPDDVYQTAKISKVLLLMESGNLKNYKGQSLDDIDVNLDEELINENEDSNDEETEELVEPDCSTQPQPSCSTEHQDNLTNKFKNQKIKKGKKRELVPWTIQQKKLVKNYFKIHIKNKKPPKRSECEDLRTKHPEVFCNKDWLKIKVFIQNQYTKYRD